MDALAGDVERPPPCTFTHRGDTAKVVRASAKEAVPCVANVPSHPWLIRGRGRTGLVHNAAVVAGKLPVGTVEAPIVAARLDHPGGEIVRHQPARRSAEESEGGEVSAQPGSAVFGQYRPGLSHRAGKMSCHSQGSRGDAVGTCGVATTAGRAACDSCCVLQVTKSETMLTVSDTAARRATTRCSQTFVSEPVNLVETVFGRN